MIEIVSAERCTGCNICVHICPTNVFDAVEQAIPVIARQSDCQTCFMCELYCPVDALYVAPDAERPMSLDAQKVVTSAMFGSYRSAIGWTPDTRHQRTSDRTFKLIEPH